MRSFIANGIAAAAVSIACLAGGQAIAADYGRYAAPQVRTSPGNQPRAEDRIHPFSANIPACDDPGVLRTISSRFAHREAHFWNSPLTVQGFYNVRSVAFRPWGDSFIPRRFCTAQAYLSDGYKRTVNYSVREALGPIGLGSNVEWCIVGLDRNYAFAPACRAALP
ncbi:hypothetical protein [Pseudochelatococcus contaminans]|uniref:Uncharacterized protein n=1 Tax=Pseudochelatococcus contaminans TaxID=1538103 RepID=A0A7W5Z3H6_9HYPH|nr:hypothetical protein [Pseudochelatococcus contaminans]MBB3809353.1 hypothetical protein [Pseudochelatococcus contaminans]